VLKCKNNFAKKSRTISLAAQGLKEAPEKVMEEAALALAAGLLGAISISQLQYLQGPRPERLGEITGRLRNSVVSKVDRTPDKITGRAGSNLSYAAFHEFGFHGVENVKGHTRVVQQVSANGEVFDGRDQLKDRAGVLIGFRQGRKAATGKQRGGIVVVQYVKPHRRRVDYPGRPYLRPALLQALPMIVKRINDAIAQVQKEASAAGNQSS
jgi:phage gpG-like protein